MQKSTLPAKISGLKTLDEGTAAWNGGVDGDILDCQYGKDCDKSCQTVSHGFKFPQAPRYFVMIIILSVVMLLATARYVSLVKAT